MNRSNLPIAASARVAVHWTMVSIDTLVWGAVDSVSTRMVGKNYVEFGQITGRIHVCAINHVNGIEGPVLRRIAIVVVWALLLTTRTVFALNAAHDVSQYLHTTWRVRDGFWGAGLRAITQTPDGYLWLGGDVGLVRFDGVRGVPWVPPPDQQLPSNVITHLLSGRDGTLWIGTDKGLASWKDGRLRQFEKLAGSIGRIVEAQDNSLWVTIAKPTNVFWTLCSMQADVVQCYGDDRGAGKDALGLYEDREGRLWVGTSDGVWQWKSEPRQFYRLSSQLDGIQGLAEHDDGLLISKTNGVTRLRDGREEMLYPYPASMPNVSANALLRDRDGGLWIGTTARGLIHIHDGVMEVFAQVDGLSSNAISRVFEDREGNIWVVTPDGLDRFRDAPVISFSARQGLSNSRVVSVLAAKDGSVWAGTVYGVNRLAGGGVTAYRDRSPGTNKWFEGPVSSLFQDRLGRVWVATFRGVGFIKNDRFFAVNGLPGGVTRAIVEDSRNLWVADQNLGLYEVSSEAAVVRHLRWTALNQTTPLTAVAADPSTAGLWMAFRGGRLINVVDGEVRASYGPADGLGDDRIAALYFDRGGTLWAATNVGLARLSNGRFTPLTRKNGLACDAAEWVVEDDRSLWIGMACGLARIPRSEIDRWAAVVATDREATPIVQTMLLSNIDGVRLFTNAAYYSAPAVATADGRVWFTSPNGLSVVDPRSLQLHNDPPPVHIEQIIAERTAYDAVSSRTEPLRFPPLTRIVQIDYTALSYVAPEKLQFRYRLEGRDDDWQAVGTRRQAFYDSLRPGRYRFRVTAANESGVWNEAGAAVEFIVAPAYYQTRWFLVLAVGTIVGLVWAAHRVRVRVVEKHEREITALNERMMKAQEQERIRIAGELHDGVMQEMLAVTLMLGTAKRRVAGDSDAQATIDKAQQKLIRVGTEIRQLSHDLHPPVLQEAGLPEAIRTYCEQFSATTGIPVSCDADDNVHNLSRGAALALFRILQEALGNAAKYAHAKKIRVRLVRADDVVSLKVSDDGVGFDASRLSKSGGLGLIMMRERASQLNGTFEFQSAPGSGTTIRVAVPFR